MDKAKKRRRRSPFRLSARLHIDLIDIAERAWGAAWQLGKTLRRVVDARAAGGEVVAWVDVPDGALVMTRDNFRCARVLLRSSRLAGSFIATVDAVGEVTVDDQIETETWSALGRRPGRGSAEVRVLARRVATDAKPEKIADLVRRALAQGGST